MSGVAVEWKLAGVSVIGKQHEDAGGRCEDAWSFARAEAQAVLSVCVSDGAGSARMGYLGAEITCKVASSWLAENFEMCLIQPQEETRVQLSDVIRQAICNAASEQTLPLKSFACTIIALAVCEDGRWFAAHLGDGAIVAIINDAAEALSVPQKGEFANETFFVTDDDASQNICILKADSTENTSATSFFLFTDGLEASLVNRHTKQVAPVLCKMGTWLNHYTEAEVTQGLEEQVTKVFRERTSDDCTIAVLAAVPLSIDNGPCEASSEPAESTEDQES